MKVIIIITLSIRKLYLKKCRSGRLNDCRRVERSIVGAIEQKVKYIKKTKQKEVDIKK